MRAALDGDSIGLHQGDAERHGKIAEPRAAAVKSGNRREVGRDFQKTGVELLAQMQGPANVTGFWNLYRASWMDFNFIASKILVLNAAKSVCIRPCCFMASNSESKARHFALGQPK